MRDVSRYVDVATRKELLLRSNNFCECCGTDVPPDKHHILEFSKGGPTNTQNLIVVCQTCHKQLPLYLSKKQQHDLQMWHQNRIQPNISSTHQFFSPVNEFVFGTNTFLGCKSLLRINGQNIIVPQEVNGRFYVNIVMLDMLFTEQLLVLGNRVIKNKDASITTNQESLVVKVNDVDLFKIQKVNGIAHIELNLTYDDQHFSFNSELINFPGNNLMRGCTFGGCSIVIDHTFREGHRTTRLGVR